MSTKASVYPVPEFASSTTLISGEQYKAMYQHSIKNPDSFWAEQAKIIDWMQPFKTVKDTSFNKEDFRIKWFADGTLNVCANCVDRHLPHNKDKIAFIFEGNEPGNVRHISYEELYHHVCRFANVLKKHGVKKGDVVTLYMPMIPEAIYAMLACARLGAIHSVVFGGFSANALAGRLDDCRSKIVITADGSQRGLKTIPLKETVDLALTKTEQETVQTVLTIKHTGAGCPMKEGQDLWYHEEARTVQDECAYEEMGAEDPLFILYTSGSTGTPKGVLHTSGGYLTYAALTHKYVFDYHDSDVYWCTADVGWITGHSYVVYGPLANGATSVIFEGVPTYPDSSRFWQIVDHHKVSIFYTAPTAIRSLMSRGDDYVTRTNRSSLRILGSVGEPLNPEAWHWYYNLVGRSTCPIVDTWWQTETGGILLTPLPGAMSLKPGSVARPFFGIQPVLLDKDGKEIRGSGTGSLAIKESWPGQMRGIYKDPERFFKTYFNSFKGYYFSEDGARRDKDGYYWITGRLDDIINVSGHRIGTAEIEAAINNHPQVAESAVIGIPHDIKGEGLFAFIILKRGAHAGISFASDLLQLIRRDVGSFAQPEKMVIVPGLPKTRSGKIMRRILRKIATGKIEDIGDTSTLSEPRIVNKISDIVLST